jgi:uncharacterized membrane-anchored protein
MIISREATLKNGKEFRFKTAPVDPYDAFRGKYVALNIDGSSGVPLEKGVKVRRGRKVYALIEEDEEGFTKIIKAVLDKPDNGDYIKAKILYQNAGLNSAALKMPFDRYYMNEKNAPEAERAYVKNSRRERQNAYVIVSVRSGHTVLKELYIADKPVLEFIKSRENKEIPAKLIKLKNAYPDLIDEIGDNYLIFKDGTGMIYDDGKNKADYEELLNTADIEDQMRMSYPKGRHYNIPPLNFDPGRVRNELFFRKMYGSTEAEVKNKLVPVRWLPHSVDTTLYVTSVNGIDRKIAAISDELEKLPEIKKYIDAPAGSFYWRTIAGTNRLSMHSFGIAFDINVNYSNYWQWETTNSGVINYVNRIPLEIVEIFEKYGFIWGGKWYHVDTMHFEYRPELIN